MNTVNADYFDGHSARAHHVVLTLADDQLLTEGDGISRCDLLGDLRVSEPMGVAPRLIKYLDGAHCQVRDHATLAGMLAEGGYRDGWVVRLQQRWRWALASVAITMAAIGAGYIWGLPAVSEWIAFKLPEKTLASMGETTLSFLDKNLFSPSKLPPARQQALRGAFAALHLPVGAARQEGVTGLVIQFRDGGAIGANALALPDGTIVVTDQLVTLAAHDAEILAVLGHELGHVERRHSLRMLIQGSIVAGVVAWYTGDVSSVAAGLPSFMLQARYSRDHEREADEYAATMMQENGIDPGRLADILEKMERAHRDPDTKEDSVDNAGLGDYLSSHPATRERIKVLRKD